MVPSSPVTDYPSPAAGDAIFPSGTFYSDEPPLETDLHREQIDLLIRLLKWWRRHRPDMYVSGNLTIYFSPNQKKSEDFRGPDFFVVLDTEPKDRKSWVVWQEEGKYPNVIVELLSESTAEIDRGYKKDLYQNTFRTPDYFWFDPESLEFKGFHLVDGNYQALTPTSENWLWSQQLELYLGIHGGKLRFFTPAGNLVLLPEEEANQQLEQERQRAEQERQRAEQERQRADQERQRAEQLAERLRAAGIDPEHL